MSAMSTGSSGDSTKQSCGSALVSSGSQRCAGSMVEAKRMFTGRGMVAFAAEDSAMRFLLLALVCTLALPLHAQDWPRQKPIHFVVGFAPARPRMVERLVREAGRSVGQSVLVEKSRGLGNVAAQQVKRAAPTATRVITELRIAATRAYASAATTPSRFHPVTRPEHDEHLPSSRRCRRRCRGVALARRQTLSASSGVGTIASSMRNRAPQRT